MKANSAEERTVRLMIILSICCEGRLVRPDRVLCLLGICSKMSLVLLLSGGWIHCLGMNLLAAA